MPSIATVPVAATTMTVGVFVGTTIAKAGRRTRYDGSAKRRHRRPG